jgi:hypothetical protein
MALDAGKKDATTGLTKAIYEALNNELGPPLEPEFKKPEDFKKVQDGWRSLSFAIATGMITALRREDPVADTLFAETFSSSAEDDKFWAWLVGFVKVFQDWKPTTTEGKALQKGITDYLAAKPVPTQLKGILR